jgi:PAS domain S-box-containing protein
MVNQAISRAVDQGREYDIEFRNLWPDGSLHWIAGRGQVIHDESGRAVRMIGIGMDITERKHSERQVAEAEARIRSVVNSVIDGIITIDHLGNVQSLNPAAEKLFGYQSSEVIHRNVKMLMPDPYRSEHDDYIANYLRTREAKIIGIGREVRGLRKDGSTFPMELSVGELRVGEHCYFTGIVRDITDRKEAERNLLESEQRLTAELQAITRLHALSSRLLAADNLITALDDVLENAIVTSGADFGNIQLHNAQIGALEIVVHRGFRQDFLDYFRLVRVTEGSTCAQAMQSGERIIIEDVALDPAYERHRQVAAAAGYRAVQSTPLKSRNGSILGMLSTHFRKPQRVSDRNQQLLDLYARHAADLIERIRVEQSLKEADRRKDEFLAMLAHELRNPLAPIRNALQILKTPAAGGSLVDMAHDVVDRQTQQLTRLVDDLLDVSRITRGKINLHRETIELSAVVKRAVEIARPLMDEQRHEFTVALPSEPIFLNGDMVRLAQALANVLNNAGKYTEKGGRVQLLAEHADSTAFIRVCDTGIGISAEVLPHIFDLFTQADRSLDRSQGGLGIGLTLVRTLVEMHGGSVEANSAGPGRGSEFIIRLPTLPTPPEDGRNSHEKPALEGKRASRRVLIVDDNRDSTETLATLIRIWDHKVETAHDGPSALAAVERFHPNVIFLDLGLPGLNGFEVAKCIRRQSDPILLVALSGYSQDGDRFRAGEAGFDYYLVKPVVPEVLRDLLIAGKCKAKETAPCPKVGVSASAT